MSRRVSGLVAAGVAACTALAACSSDEHDADSDSSATATAPADDTRDLADWAAVQMLQKNSTEVCEVGTKYLEIEFGERGWCENDVKLKETAVTLELVATCEGRGDEKAPPGDVYVYYVEPDITWIPGEDSDNGLVVTVDDSNGDAKVSNFYPDSFDPEEIADTYITTCKAESLTATSPAEDVPLD